MPSFDRRDIAPLLESRFPDMADASSDEWSAFLDAKTGLVTPPDMPNGDAFDAWRRALANLGFEGVWRHTPEQAEALKERGKAMAEKAREYRKAQDAAAQAEVIRIKRIEDVRAKEREKRKKAGQ